MGLQKKMSRIQARLRMWWIPRRQKKRLEKAKEKISDRLSVWKKRE